jgi:hypothetical protein
MSDDRSLMFSAFAGVSSIASHTLGNRFLVTCPVEDINRIGKLGDINDTERPSALEAGGREFGRSFGQDADRTSSDPSLTSV